MDDTTGIHEDFRRILGQQESDPGLNDDEALLFGDEPDHCVEAEFEIDSAYQGQEAVQMVQRAVAQHRPYAVAFVDMRMPPGWDGLETIQHLWPEDPEVEIVICTAYSDYTWSDIVKRLDRSDRITILKKPFETIEVRQLAYGLSEKRQLRQLARLKTNELERMVEERTAELTNEIAERKRAEQLILEKEEQLRQKQKLEAIGSLAGGVAHEFNNLLQAIQGYIEFASNDLPRDEQPFKDLEQALSAAEKAKTITRQLLDLSRRETSKRLELDINEIITTQIDLLCPLIGNKIEMDVSLGDDLGAVLGEAIIIDQILTNLCVNALDAMPNGGRLSIKTRTVILADGGGDDGSPAPDLMDGRYIVLTFTDTGCGMSPEVQERVFDPFFTTKDVGKGTGIGLAMVYGAVEEHGGAITVHSQPDVGSTFRVYLPIANEASPSRTRADVEARQEAALGGTETILIAEDEPLVRQLTVQILEGAGYGTIVARDGEEAVHLFEKNKNRIALALLDMLMPKMNGHEVGDQIQQLGPDVPIVFCSGYQPEGARVELTKADGPRLVMKPFQPDELLHTVRETLDERSDKSRLGNDKLNDRSVSSILAIEDEVHVEAAPQIVLSD